MVSSNDQLHFVLFPFMAQGHLIPMVDIARLLSQHGVIVTIITTPVNAARFEDGLVDLKINVIKLQLRHEQAGLPQNCENLDMLSSLGSSDHLFLGTSLLQQPADEEFGKLAPKPSCLISDMCLPWTAKIASKYQVPRVSFCGSSCFCLAVVNSAHCSGILERVNSETEPFVLPGLPGCIEFRKCQVPGPLLTTLAEFNDEVTIAERDGTYGVITNSFEELEPEYDIELKKTRAGKSWCIGPVSLCNKDKFHRGNKTMVDENECSKWLDSWGTGSVLYVCFGSLCNLILPQLVELGMALEALDIPFIWVIRKGDNSELLKNWVAESGLEERILGRGLIIWGWAPQVLILSHPAVGGFLTHCGWNSMLEAISTGVPMVTWPLFADQFCNEKLAVHVLDIGVSVGVQDPLRWGEEEQIGVLVDKQDIVRAVTQLMREGKEKEERRERAKELAEKGKRALEEGGSSFVNMEMLIHEISQHVNNGKCNKEHETTK